MIDWGQGEYEHTGNELWPAAEHVVVQAKIGEDDRVLDLGTGTGNAALLAARTGAEVTAVDPAQRLLSVARERLAGEDLDADFVQASAGELPFPEESFDVVLSIFAVIFADDPARAAAEIVRILDLDGRAFITTWAPEGGIFDAIGVLSRAVSALAPEGAHARFEWGNPQVVTELFEQAGAIVDVTSAELVTTADSAETFVSRFESVHPVGMVFREALTAAGAYDEPRAQAIEALHAASGTADGQVRVVSPYYVFRITK